MKHSTIMAIGLLVFTSILGQESARPLINVAQDTEQLLSILGFTGILDCTRALNAHKHCAVCSKGLEEYSRRVNGCHHCCCDQNNCQYGKCNWCALETSHQKQLKFYLSSCAAGMIDGISLSRALHPQYALSLKDNFIRDKRYIASSLVADFVTHRIMSRLPKSSARNAQIISSFLPIAYAHYFPTSFRKQRIHRSIDDVSISLATQALRSTINKKLFYKGMNKYPLMHVTLRAIGIGAGYALNQYALEPMIDIIKQKILSKKYLE